jgi:MtN3 and saliva related transmembrane protein
MVDYIGYAAGVLTVSSFLPQVIRTWKTKKARDLSYLMLVLLITSGSLWLLYGVLTRDAPLIVTNSGMVALCCAILAGKIRFRDERQPDSPHSSTTGAMRS